MIAFAPRKTLRLKRTLKWNIKLCPLTRKIYYGNITTSFTYCKYTCSLFKYFYTWGDVTPDEKNNLILVSSPIWEVKLVCGERKRSTRSVIRCAYLPPSKARTYNQRISIFTWLATQARNILWYSLVCKTKWRRLQEITFQRIFDLIKFVFLSLAIEF